MAIVRSRTSAAAVVGSAIANGPPSARRQGRISGLAALRDARAVAQGCGIACAVLLLITQ
jgi:hypothetical protein